MDKPTLSIEMCRKRQQRLISAVEALNVDWVIASRFESIQWLTGWRSAPVYAPIAALKKDGHVILVMPETGLDASAAVDTRIFYTAQKHGTLRDDQRSASASALISAIGERPRRIACEFSAFDQYLAEGWKARLWDIEPLLSRLRRNKDPDELAMIDRAITANRAMYEYARQAVRSGVCELELFAELYRVAVTLLGEPPTYFGQDFQCNSRGGPPRVRRAEQGELYILDLGVGYRGYYSDNARTIAVGGNPTSDQLRAWEAVSQVFELIQARVRPGVSCTDVFEEVQKLLDQYQPWVFDHHLGHGIGLAPHEAPHLNPRWNDQFEEGDVIAVEPGLYHVNLRTGVRLEQNYRITADHVELLSDWPLTLC